MRTSERLFLPALGVVSVLLAADLVHMRSAGAAPTNDVTIVAPLAGNGAVDTTVRGVVRTRPIPIISHVGQPAGNLVTFIAHSDGTFNYVRGDGTSSGLIEFPPVPAGQALVLTDFQWLDVGDPGERSYVRVSTGSSDVLYLSDNFDQNGFIWRSISMTTGIALPAGASLSCFFSSINLDDAGFLWDPLESTCRHASLSIL